MHLGIDIASVDGNKPIDWLAAKAAGVEFAYFRASYKTWADPTWAREASRARAAGFHVGAYLFPVMDTGAPPAHEQAAIFASVAGKPPAGDLPWVLDVEFPAGITKTGQSRAQLIAWIGQALHDMQAVCGYWPMIYTSARVWDGDDTDSLDSPDVGYPECPLWLARYPYKTRIAPQLGVDNLPKPPVPKAWGDADDVWIHQYQGDAIGLPGFSATVDLNRFFSLGIGARGERVKWIQKRLKLVSDGIFGPLTERAVQVFQKTNNLVITGGVDVATFAHISSTKL